MFNNELTSADCISLNSDSSGQLLLGNKLFERKVTCWKRWCFAWIPARFVLTFWTFLGLFVVYALRANLSVAIVAMVKNPPDLTNGTNSSSSCPKLGNHTSSTLDFDADGEFAWDSTTQGNVLGAFFYGYIITQLPGGLLAERFGGKWLFGIGTLIASIATLLTPIAARCHVFMLYFVRFIAGIGEGVTFPSYFALYSHWVPRQERSIILAITNCGIHFGIVVAMPATAWLCEYGFNGGWPSVFYVFGIVGCLWFVFWTLIISGRPEDHPRISPSELKYIVENRGNAKKILHFASIPWKHILSSLPVWCLALTKAGNSWSMYTLMTELPTFMKKVLNYSIGENGSTNSLLYVAIAVSTITAGATSDYIRAKQWFSVTTLRKIYQSVASFLPAVCISLIPFAGCNSTAVIGLLLAAMTFQGFAGGGGEAPSAMDMSPEYIGIVYGICNCLGNIPGFLAPLVTGLLTTENSGYERWQYVFYIAAAVNAFGGVAFLLFGSASPQPWPLPYKKMKSPSANRKIYYIDCDKTSDGNTSKEVHVHS